jgi:hypothetical protein
MKNFMVEYDGFKGRAQASMDQELEGKKDIVRPGG